MCGIVLYSGKKPALDFLLQGLESLEYRGYDSAGVELLEETGDLVQRKCEGRVAALAEVCANLSSSAQTGIAHTRWATHGKPSDANAHPHRSCDGTISIVHNGIIENYRSLREELERQGHKFASETDSEVIAHLIEQAYENGAVTLREALSDAVRHLKGAWAIGAVTSREPSTIVVTRKAMPLVLASTKQGAYGASDVVALGGISKQVINLRDDELAIMHNTGQIDVVTLQGEPVATPDTFVIDWDESAASLLGHPDYMAKEIAEQPTAIEKLLEGRLSKDGIKLDELALSDEEIAAIDRIFIVACGTSYHVGLLARSYIETWTKIPVSVETAGEFNHQNALVSAHTLCIIITQSGETADTLQAARKMASAGAHVLAITNVVGSSAAREADAVLYVKAGPEVSVASTKAYTAQIMASMLVALFLAQKNGSMGPREVKRHYEEFLRTPQMIREVLARHWQDEAAAPVFLDATSAFFIGRGRNAITALEGALKLKEISYLHAEGYPAAEMKHGPIALISQGFPVVVICPDDGLTREKTLSNLEEAKARGATIISVATDGDQKTAQLSNYVLLVPPAPHYLLPIICIIHLQMLARYVALMRGCDIDKPRNLAKSVTVE